MGYHLEHCGIVSFPAIRICRFIRGGRFLHGFFYSARVSVFKPGMRSNSLMLLVMRIPSWKRTMDAFVRSVGPILVDILRNIVHSKLRFGNHSGYGGISVHCGNELSCIAMARINLLFVKMSVLSVWRISHVYICYTNRCKPITRTRT